MNEQKQDWKYNLKRIEIEIDFLGDGVKRIMALQDILEGNIKPVEDFISQKIQKASAEADKRAREEEREKTLKEIILTNEWLKPAIDQIRLETLKEVLPEEMRIEEQYISFQAGFNNCRQEIINKAKDKWGIIL